MLGAAILATALSVATSGAPAIAVDGSQGAAVFLAAPAGWHERGPGASRLSAEQARSHPATATPTGVDRPAAPRPRPRVKASPPHRGSPNPTKAASAAPATTPAVAAIGTSGALALSTAGSPVAALTSALGTALSRPLPPVTPAPAIAPILEGPSVASAPPSGEAGRFSIVWTIIALLVVAALAWLAGASRVLRLEETLGISQVVTTGFPFIVLGMLARLHRVNVLSDQVLAEFSPVLRLGLGWIGLIVGFRFDATLLGGLPRGTGRIVAFTTSIPFACVLAATGAILLVTSGLSHESLRDPVFVRDALLLGTAAAMTAVTATRAAGMAAETVARLVRIEELAGIAGLSLVAAFFRPTSEASWSLPAMAWIILTVGLGAAVGLLVYGILLQAASEVEFTALVLGSVSFAAGLAGHLRLSSVVVAFIVGALLANVPGAPRAKLGAALERLERPTYLLSLFVIGALWDVFDWRGWALIPVFAGARLFGKWLAVRLAVPRSGIALPEDARNALVFSPTGPLAIAIVVNAELLYPGGSISRIVAAVIGGAVLTEIVVQLHARRSRDSVATMLTKGSAVAARAEAGTVSRHSASESPLRDGGSPVKPEGAP